MVPYQLIVISFLVLDKHNQIESINNEIANRVHQSPEMNVLWRINALLVVKHILIIVTNPPHSEGREHHTNHCMYNR